MTRRSLAVIGLTVFVMALAVVSLQPMWPTASVPEGTETRWLKDQTVVHADRTAAGVLVDEWRRVNWELGRRPPQIEDREAY